MFRPEYDDRVYMDEMDEFAQRNIRESMGTQEAMERADPFREAHLAITPERRSPMMEYAPGIGEPPSPTVMGMHTRDFAMERGIPFEEEDHRITSLADDEFMSTIPPGATNYEDRLQGMYENDFTRQSSLLMEPVSMNPDRFGEEHRAGWPAGAVAYVGRNELEDNWDRYGLVGGEHINDEYIRNKEADPEWSPPESMFWHWDPETTMYR